MYIEEMVRFGGAYVVTFNEDYESSMAFQRKSLRHAPHSDRREPFFVPLPPMVIFPETVSIVELLKLNVPV